MSRGFARLHILLIDELHEVSVDGGVHEMDGAGDPALRCQGVRFSHYIIIDSLLATTAKT